jgi:hypothetical protein
VLAHSDFANANEMSRPDAVLNTIRP